MSTVATVSRTLHEGNARDIRIRLRRKGQRGYWDVSAAISGTLEIERVLPEGNVVLTPLALSKTYAGADWVNGLIVFPVGPSDVTALTGSYRCTLTLNYAAGSSTLVEVMFDVLSRPGV